MRNEKIGPSDLFKRKAEGDRRGAPIDLGLIKRNPLSLFSFETLFPLLRAPSDLPILYLVISLFSERSSNPSAK
jgi:hypothetical protein